LDIIVVTRDSPIPNVGEFILIHMNAVSVYDMAKAIHAISIKIAFLPLEIELSLPLLGQPLNYLLKA